MKKSKFLPAILGVATLASSVALPYNTFADSKTAEVTVSIAESLSLTLSNNAVNFDLSDTTFQSDSLTVTGSTNAVNGYTISFNANNGYNDLKHSNVLIEDKIESITEDKTETNFPATAWGFSTDAETFKQIPVTSTSVFATSAKGQNDHTFTLGAKAAANMAAGDYQNELLFTIVANPEPGPGPNYLLMQDIANWKENLELEQQIQAMDARDGKIYWVAKLKDGNIWMTQNLDYDLSVVENQTLTPETSNVTENRMVTPVSSWGSNNNAVYYADGGDNYFIGGITQTAGFSSLPEDSIDRHYAEGDYYSWNAATAGQGTTDIVNTDVNESICPSGWRLPSGDVSGEASHSLKDLIAQYGYSSIYPDYYFESTADLNAPLFFVRNGLFETGSIHYYSKGTMTLYWSSRARSDNRYADALYFNSLGLGPSVLRYNGFSVRCVAK